MPLSTLNPVDSHVFQLGAGKNSTEKLRPCRVRQVRRMFAACIGVCVRGFCQAHFSAFVKRQGVWGCRVSGLRVWGLLNVAIKFR